MYMGTAARQASVPTDRGYQLMLPHKPLQGPVHAPEEVWLLLLLLQAFWQAVLLVLRVSVQSFMQGFLQSFFKLPSHEGGLKSRGFMALSKRLPQTNLMQSDSSPETMLPLGVEILPALVTRYPQK